MPAIAPLEPPSFAQAMGLERVSATDEIYMSTFPALSFDYAPGKPLSVQRSYGGHAYAQAIWAASLTINDSEFGVHEANGYWTQAGHANRPFVYEVKTVSLTRSFILRQVTARQPTAPSDQCPFPTSDASKEFGPVAFVLTCSFKRREEGPSYWVKFDSEKYGEILRNDPMSYPRNVYLQGSKGIGKIKLADFPGIDIRTPDITDYNSRNPGTAHRRLHIYRAFTPMEMDPRLIAVAHAYVSDRASLSVLVHAFGESQLGVAGSLNHKIIFHVNPTDLIIDDKTWFVQEMSSSRGGAGRAIVDGRIWGPSGALVATSFQEAMFRRPLQSKLS